MARINQDYNPLVVVEQTNVAKIRDRNQYLERVVIGHKFRNNNHRLIAQSTDLLIDQ